MKSNPKRFDGQAKNTKICQGKFLPSYIKRQEAQCFLIGHSKANKSFLLFLRASDKIVCCSFSKQNYKVKTTIKEIM